MNSNFLRRPAGQRSVASFCLCRATEAQHPFHFKRREPFSRHKRSHHLFRQSSHGHCRVKRNHNNKKGHMSEYWLSSFFFLYKIKEERGKKSQRARVKAYKSPPKKQTSPQRQPRSWPDRARASSKLAPLPLFRAQAKKVSARAQPKVKPTSAKVKAPPTF